MAKKKENTEIEEKETSPLFQEGTSSIDEKLIDIPAFLRLGKKR